MRLLLPLLLTTCLSFISVNTHTIAKWDPDAPRVRVVPDEIVHRVTRAPPSTFSVSYDTATPTAVRTAVEYVLSLLDSWLVFSTQAPIRIQFQWTLLGAGILGSASPSWVSGGNNKPAALYASQNNLYPIGGSSWDIYARFSSSNTISWNFNTTGNPSPGQYDFPTVFMHEVIHGLGFATLYGLQSGSPDPPTGLYNFNTPTVYSSVFDRLLYNTAPNPDIALQMLATRNQNQAGLLSAAESGSVVYRTANGTEIAIYAPNSYEPGSSLAHLSPSVYGGINSLMLPTLTNGQAYHWPGQPVFIVLESVGYTLKTSTKTSPPPITTQPVPTPLLTSPRPAATPTVKPTATPSLSPSPSASPSPSSSTTPPSPTFSTFSATTSNTPAPIILSAWEGSYSVDSSGCDPANCCCPTGTASFIHDLAANILSITVSVRGQCQNGASTVELRLGLFSDEDQSGSLLWEGLTYSVSIRSVPAVITIASSSCSVTATCQAGPCLSPSVVSSASLPFVSFSIVLAALFLSFLCL